MAGEAIEISRDQIEYPKIQYLHVYEFSLYPLGKKKPSGSLSRVPPWKTQILERFPGGRISHYNPIPHKHTRGKR